MPKAKQKTVMSSAHGISHISFTKQSDVLSLGKKELDDQCYLYRIDTKPQKKGKTNVVMSGLGNFHIRSWW